MLSQPSPGLQGCDGATPQPPGGARATVRGGRTLEARGRRTPLHLLLSTSMQANGAATPVLPVDTGLVHTRPEAHFSGGKIKSPNLQPRWLRLRAQLLPSILCHVPCRSGKERRRSLSDSSVGARRSPALSCPGGAEGDTQPEVPGPAPGLPGLWSRRFPGPQGHPCHPSQDTPGRSQPEPTSHTPRPTLHRKFPARPRLQNPSLRGSQAPEGPKPQPPAGVTAAAGSLAACAPTPSTQGLS